MVNKPYAKLGTYDFVVKAVDEHIQVAGQYVSAEGTVSVTVGTIPTISGMFDYEVRGGGMAVTAYHKDKNSTPATVSVPASLSYRGTTFTVDAIDSPGCCAALCSLPGGAGRTAAGTDGGTAAGGALRLCLSG